MTEDIRIIRKYEVKYFNQIKPVIQEEVNAVIHILEISGFQDALRYITNHIHSKELPQIIRQLYVEVGGRFARKQWIKFQFQKRAARKPKQLGGIIKNNSPYVVGELGPELFIPKVASRIIPNFQQKGFGFNAEWVRWILNFFSNYLFDKVTFQIARTTREILTNTLNTAISEGWGLQRTVQYLKNEKDFNLSAMQSARIARTETTRAANAGAYAAGQTFPFEQTKEWIAAHDDRTRGQEKHPHASHVLLDGQTIDYESFFVDPINGDKLLFPGDPNGSAASVINCRCNLALVAKVDENGRLIDKVNNQILIQQYGV